MPRGAQAHGTGSVSLTMKGTNKLASGWSCTAVCTSLCFSEAWESGLGQEYNKDPKNLYGLEKLWAYHHYRRKDVEGPSSVDPQVIRCYPLDSKLSAPFSASSEGGPLGEIVWRMVEGKGEGVGAVWRGSRMGEAPALALV